jgi:hypothetical protein
VGHTGLTARILPGKAGPRGVDFASGKPITDCVDCPAHSVRNAVMGVTRVARRAGKKQARSEALPSITIAAARTIGSFGLTW